MGHPQLLWAAVPVAHHPMGKEFLTAYLNLPSTQYHSPTWGTQIYPQDPAGDADFGKTWDLLLAGLRARGGQTQPSVNKHYRSGVGKPGFS